MERRVIPLACLLVLMGGSVMAFERFSLNQNKIDILKQEMNYPQVIAQLPEQKIIILDWVAALENFKDDEGTVWNLDISAYGDETGHGYLDASLHSPRGSVSIVIHSLSEGVKAAVDLALWEATNNNADFIYYKYAEHAIGDFSLVPRNGNIVRSLLFVYGNILIELTHPTYEDRQDVISIARHLQITMDKAVAANPEGTPPPRPIFQYSVGSQQIKLGRTFKVTVTPDYDQAVVGFDVAEEVLSENIEYEEDLGGGVYKFTAKAAGVGTVAFSVMDKKTLWTFTDTFKVNID